MAGRFSVLVDPETERALEGAIEVVDSHTVQLNLPRPDISLIAGMADWRSLYNHTREGLGGAAQHISLEIRPAQMYWS